ncbi:hypothetical protein [Staphylococcus simulans]|uniref:hypothetical protein n=1 Tax=Staphylococcus simulans TaxID=1286 RepID=UPI000D025BB2|nr:hypothetical protein [Staphylococcus simulans]MDQ7112102.1 hypothetical protein [Staphylococcus simulans]MDQ7118259.1 hypothetical protein [Staphylococcus simulans]PTI93609.1 hypothetical protein BU045_05390 [Staphylococcus simulans]PTI95714.1 hypothetical protein BU048_12680 [Staphylococcus simulans]PTJ04073.1 hypothetical protein BU046_09870 [Staphylococcus simulans]
MKYTNLIKQLDETTLTEKDKLKLLSALEEDAQANDKAEAAEKEEQEQREAETNRRQALQSILEKGNIRD